MINRFGGWLASVAVVATQLAATPVLAQSRDTTASVPAPTSSSRPPSGGGSNNGNWSGSGSSNSNNNWGGSGSSNNNWNGSGSSSGTLTCESRNNQYRRCNANTRNNVQLVRRLGGNCVEGRSWGYDRNAIWVDNGCRAQFRYGWSGGGGGGGYPPPNQNWGRGYAGTMRCESWNWAYRRCNVRTSGRVDLLRTTGGTCQRGRSWGFDNNSIWVNNGCRGEFGYGFGNNNGNNSNNNTGEVIAGVALAAGLVALLAASSNSGKSSSAPPQVNASAPPAAIVANLASIPADRRPSVETCLNEAARQIGATGGTQISLDRIDSLTRVSDGWQLQARLISSYPDESRSVVMTCRADGPQLIGIDFGS